MTQSLQITFRDFRPSQALELRTREKFEKLRAVCPDITSCHVVFETPHRHHNKGRLFGVKIELSVPGQTICVSRESHADHSHESAHVALRDAFNRARRQLVSHHDRAVDPGRATVLSLAG